jgi:phosphoserine phosphatase
MSPHARDSGLNIDRIERLSSRVPLVATKVRRGSASSSAPARRVPTQSSTKPLVRTRLAALAESGLVDVAFSTIRFFRRNRRLVAFDMDSTLIQGEVIDELARRPARASRSRRSTEAAMRGELDFQQSFRRSRRAAQGTAGIRAPRA